MIRFYLSFIKFPQLNIKENANYYVAQKINLTDARQCQNNLCDKKWSQHGHSVENINIPDQLCLCEVNPSWKEIKAMQSWCFERCNHKPWVCEPSYCVIESCRPKRVSRCKGPACRTETETDKPVPALPKSL